MSTRLQRELERMADMQEANDLLCERIERLEAALKPFADLARTYKVETGEINSPDDKPVFGLNDAHIRVGDLRAVLDVMTGG